MRRLEITILGGFEARLDGRPLASLPKKTQACLAYLALDPKAVHARHELAALLWGDTGEAQAQQSLRKNFSIVRQRLGEAADEILRLQEGSAALNRDAIAVDALQFERCVAGGSPAELTEAAALYRGHLLSGVDVDEGPFNDWLLVERERLRELALNAIGRLLRHHLERGAFDEAAATATRLLAIDPLHEPTHRALMELFARQGRRADAVRQYRLCAEVLWRELHVTPDAATEALYRDIMSRQAPAAATGHDVVGSPADGSLPAAPPPTVSPPAGQPSSRSFRARALAIAAALILTGSVVALVLLASRRVPAAPRDGVVIAVLPMANLSADPANEYLADGVTEALIHDLAQIRALRVISRTSVMRYKQTTKPLGTIARELGADLVLEGSVQASDTRMRITLQLIDAASDQHLFSRTFETTADRLFDTGREIARQIASEVSVQITPAEDSRLSVARKVHPEAYRNYLLGRHFWNRRTVATLRTAAEHFHRAVELDPTFALGFAALAETYVLLGDEEFAGMPPREALALTHEYAGRAITLDPNVAEAYSARALARQNFEWDWHAAEADYREALRLNPGSATAQSWYGWLQIARGRADQAIDSFERARELDPLSLVVVSSCAEAYYFARRFDEALARYDAALQLDPNYPGAHVGRARVLGVLGRHQEALAEYEWALRAGFDVRQAMGAAGMMAQLGDKAGAMKRLEEIRARKMYLPSALQAQLHFSFGEFDAALAALERAVDERSSTMPMLLVSPGADALWEVPRFVALARRVNPELAAARQAANATPAK
jgi:DNA-binding SARP family transcriptional activator/TolB-like protein/Tfp pilus assembly protein PilF